MSAMPSKMRRTEGRLIDSLADHVRAQHPDLNEDAVQREARKLYEGPARPSPLGPLGLQWREDRQRRIMADIKARSGRA